MMSHSMLGKLLEPLGLSQVNNEYLLPLTNRLEDLDTDFIAITESLGAMRRIIDALKKQDESRAIALALEFLRIDEGLPELRAIREQTRWSSSLESVLEEAYITKALHEIERALNNDINEHEHIIEMIMADAADLITSIHQKVERLPEVSEQWTWLEKVGTPDAIEDATLAIAKLTDCALQAKMDLVAMRKQLTSKLVH